MVENKILNAKLIIKHKSSQAWKEIEDTVLLEGEIAYETDTHKFKLGDGSTQWKDLEYGIVAKEAMHEYKPFVILAIDWKDDYSEELETYYSALIPDESISEKDSCFVQFDKSLIAKANTYGISSICESIQGNIKVFASSAPLEDMMGFYEVNVSINH